MAATAPCLLKLGIAEVRLLAGHGNTAVAPHACTRGRRQHTPSAGMQLDSLPRFAASGWPGLYAHIPQLH